MSKLLLLVRLFAEFFKVGLFSVGGGLATLPFLYEMSDKTGWFSYEELTNMIAVGESTPGPIGVNMATYTGFTTAGVSGSFAATLGLITPSFLVILLVCRILDRFRESKAVNGAFSGLRPASTALICAAFLSMLTTTLLTGTHPYLSQLLDSNRVTPLSWWETSVFSPKVFSAMLSLPSLALTVLLFLSIRKFKKLHPAVFLGIGALAGILLKL